MPKDDWIGTVSGLLVIVAAFAAIFVIAHYQENEIDRLNTKCDNTCYEMDYHPRNSSIRFIQHIGNEVCCYCLAPTNDSTFKIKDVTVC